LVEQDQEMAVEAVAALVVPVLHAEMEVHQLRQHLQAVLDLVIQ
jgi:hypothetical protein